MLQGVAIALASASVILGSPIAQAVPRQQNEPSTAGEGVSVTPQDKFSSSVGVLGCKIDINRVAYWPGWPDCSQYCIRVKAKGREVKLLLVDTSEGNGEPAHDISYDAWNYLNAGQSATEHATYGGGIPATWEYVPNSECADLIHTPDGRLPLSAPTASVWYSSCPEGTASLYNIYTSQCDMGCDELCEMPPPEKGDQPICPSTLGIQTPQL